MFSLFQLLNVAGFECFDYGVLNGSLFDLAGDAVWDKLSYDVAAGEFAAAVASPDCSAFSKLHDLPGPPPLRDASGQGRYARDDITIAQTENIGVHNLIPLWIAKVLGLFQIRGRLGIFEALAVSDKQVSVLNLNGYIALLQLPGDKKKERIQYPLCAISSKPMAWVHFAADLDDMPEVCPHPERHGSAIMTARLLKPGIVLPLEQPPTVALKPRGPQ